MPHPFLSDEWIKEARAIRARHEDDAPAVPVSIKMNQVITDVPFGDGTVYSYLDTTSGVMLLELGQLDEPEVTITTDYETAKSIFVDQDFALAMQAFMGGKIRVQGDMMKLMALQAAAPVDAKAQVVAEQIKAITA
ncbi:MAG: SCP2 sterol-binding domain-containing protein [Actinomycetota bacterium]|nr:SCP2 sterol-binding domain-containing protein [Actinomycetota bacterium]